MRIAGIIQESVVDGPGVRLVIFAQGCPHHCLGCHNPETWDPVGGEEMRIKDIIKIIKKKHKQIRGITLSGGDPFMQAPEMAEIAEEAQKMGLDVATYTGYTLEQLQALKEPGVKELLLATDILIDGPFILELRDISLAFRGSSNQRVIDLAATRESGNIVLYA